MSTAKWEISEYQRKSVYFSLSLVKWSQVNGMRLHPSTDCDMPILTSSVKPLSYFCGLEIWINWSNDNLSITTSLFMSYIRFKDNDHSEALKEILRILRRLRIQYDWVHWTKIEEFKLIILKLLYNIFRN